MTKNQIRRPISLRRINGFDKSRRLLSASDYKAVFDHNCFRATHKNVLLLARLNQLQVGRLGLVVSKKHVRLAVDRNRLKRISREQFRLHNELTQGLDMVVIARSQFGTLNSLKLAAVLCSLFEVIQQQVKKND